MKKISKIISVIIFLLLSSCNSISLCFRNKINLTQKPHEYKILSIDSLNNDFNYEIYAECTRYKKDTILIFSPKYQKCDLSRKKIMKDSIYQLSLREIWRYKSHLISNGDTVYTNRIMNIYWDKSKAKFVNIFYTSENLCGLHYIRDTLKTIKK